MLLIKDNKKRKKKKNKRSLHISLIQYRQYKAFFNQISDMLTPIFYEILGFFLFL